MDNHKEPPTQKQIKAIHILANTYRSHWKQNGTVKFLITALCIFVLFVYVGIIQEKVMRGCYGGDASANCKNGEKFTFAMTVVLIKTFFGLVLIQAMNLLKPEKRKDTTQYWYYAIVATASSLTMVCVYMALTYVTYPMQVIFKSAKPLSVMLMGLMFCKRYKVQRYFFVLIIVTGVTMFKLFEKKEEKADKHTNTADNHDNSDLNQMYGIGILIFSLFLDGILGSVQDRIRAIHSPTFRQFMYGTDIFSCAFLTIGVLVTGEMIKVVHFIQRHPSILWQLGTLSIADAVGNIFIYIMISSFGSLACSITTTVRKSFSVIFSIIFFGNPSTNLQWLGAALVFSGLFADAIFGKGKKKQTKSNKNDDVEKGETIDNTIEKSTTDDNDLSERKTNTLTEHDSQAVTENVQKF